MLRRVATHTLSSTPHLDFKIALSESSTTTMIPIVVMMKPLTQALKQ